MADLYAARSEPTPPQPWQTFAPPFPAMQLQSGQPQTKGNARGPAYAYNVKTFRDQEARIAEHAEEGYEQFVAAWRLRLHSACFEGCPAALPADAHALRHKVRRAEEE